MDIKNLIESKKFVPNPLKDQYFLIDEKVISDLISSGELNKNDTVLEIGAGFGNITQEIAKQAKKVITFEIDKRFTSFLHSLSDNVDLHMQDAWKYIQVNDKFRRKKEFNKIIASIPYSFCEKLLRSLIFIEYKKVVLIVPLKFVNTIKENGVFSSFFDVELIEIINKNSFYPIPRTNSALINLKKLDNPIKTKDLAVFLRQYIYYHEDARVKNSLREGLILYSKLALNKHLTKNQARSIIDESNINRDLIDKLPDNFEVYNQISIGFTSGLMV